MASAASSSLQPILARSFPFALYILLLATEGLLAGWAPDLDLRWLYPLKASLVTLALALLWRHFSELHRWGLSVNDVVLALSAGAAVLFLWVALDASWMLMGESGPGYDPHGADGALDWRLVAFRIAGAALVVPLMEEIFWRSFLQRWLQQAEFLALDPARVGLKALLLASVLFAVEHVQWFAGLAAGLIYGWLYVHTRKLWVPVLAHAATNAGLGVFVVATGRWEFW